MSVQGRSGSVALPRVKLRLPIAAFARLELPGALARRAARAAEERSIVVDIAIAVDVEAGRELCGVRGASEWVQSTLQSSGEW